MWGGMSIDIVARCSWSFAMLSASEVGSRSPSTALNSRRLFTVCFRCQVASSHSAAVTPRYPGILVQSGSTNSRAGG